MVSTRAILAVALAATAAASAYGQGKEVPVDINGCWAGQILGFEGAQGAVFRSYQVFGSMNSATPGGAFDGAGLECVGTYEFAAGALRLAGYCAFVDRQGDRAWGRDIRTKDEDSFELLGGTGKYLGITGTLKRVRPPPGALPRPGTIAGCARTVGTYRVP